MNDLVNKKYTNQNNLCRMSHATLYTLIPVIDQLAASTGLCWCKRLGKKERDAIAAGNQQYRHDNQTLSLQVEALQAQLEEQTRLSREQLEAMTEDRRVKQEEFDGRRQRETDKIQVITKK